LPAHKSVPFARVGATHALSAPPVARVGGFPPGAQRLHLSAQRQSDTHEESTSCWLGSDSVTTGGVEQGVVTLARRAADVMTPQSLANLAGIDLPTEYLTTLPEDLREGN